MAEKYNAFEFICPFFNWHSCAIYGTFLGGGGSYIFRGSPIIAYTAKAYLRQIFRH